MKRKKRDRFLAVFAAIVFIAFIVIFIFVLIDLSRSRRELSDSRVQIERSLMENRFLAEKLRASEQIYRDTLKKLELKEIELNIADEKARALEKENAQLVSANRVFEERLHSLTELKRAIRAVKLEIHLNKLRSEVLHREKLRESDLRQLSEGNRGYLVKDGVSFYRTQVRIEVRPAD